MTFDEMIEKLLNNEDYNTDGLSVDDVITLIEVLRLEYAPTVEMSKRHADNLIDMKNDGYSFVETIADMDGGVVIHQFDSYWNPLTVDELMQAWQHPETIKIIDEEQL